MVAKLFSLPSPEVSGRAIDAFKVSLISLPAVERRVWVSCKTEVVEGDVAFTPVTLVMLTVLGPADHSEAKALAVGMVGMSVVSEEVLRAWTLPAVPSSDEEGVELLTRLALVATVLSVLDKKTTESGSVLFVLSGALVVMEEVTLWTENVLDPDTLSPRAEADDNRGMLTVIFMSRAKPGSEEEKGCLVFNRFNSRLVSPQECEVPIGDDSNREEENVLNNGFVFPRVRESAVVVSDETMDIETIFLETVKSVFVSVEAAVTAGRCFVFQVLSVLLSSTVEISVRAVYL